MSSVDISCSANQSNLSVARGSNIPIHIDYLHIGTSNRMFLACDYSWGQILLNIEIPSGRPSPINKYISESVKSSSFDTVIFIMLARLN